MVYSYKCPESEPPRWRYVLSEYFLFSLYVHFTHMNQTNHPLSNTCQGWFFFPLISLHYSNTAVSATHNIEEPLNFIKHLRLTYRRPMTSAVP